MIGPRRRPGPVLLGLFLVTIAVVAVTPFIGEQTLDPRVVLTPESRTPEAIIFWQLRLPRCIMAFVAGAGLSVSGMVFQALFQNPLASPFTLGVAGGASFGAALYVRLGCAATLFGIAGISIAAFLGALLSMVMVYALTRRVSGAGAHVLLAGIAVNFTFTGAISFVQYLSNYADSFRILRWLMGGLEVAGFENITQLVPLVVVGIAAALLYTRELNLINTGEELALSRGVSVRAVKGVLFTTTSLMVGGIVSFAGPIGFVGMMAPHMGRRLVGGHHRQLAPASILLGGLILTLSDTVARTVIAPTELPVGVMTSLFGGPFFLWLLLREKGGDRV